MREAELSRAEQEQVIEGIEESMRALEQEYIRAIDQHDREQRRASIATGGAIVASQEFDPNRSIEADIMRSLWALC